MTNAILKIYIIKTLLTLQNEELYFCAKQKLKLICILSWNRLKQQLDDVYDTENI